MHSYSHSGFPKPENCFSLTIFSCHQLSIHSDTSSKISEKAIEDAASIQQPKNQSAIHTGPDFTIWQSSFLRILSRTQF